MYTYKKILEYVGIGIFMILGYMGKDYYIHKEYQEDIATRVLRFHVVANSDSKADQSLKLKVRDAIGTYMAPRVKEADSMAECEKIVEASIPDILQTAENVIKKEGYEYSVTASLGQADFPVKTYGAYTFPEGEYEALNVVIGEGDGHNWWCVMYPNMCFSGSAYEIVDEEAKESLERALTPEEYESLMEDKNYEIRFKYLSFLN